MAVVTKNRNFFNWKLLLYYKSKWAQFLTAASTSMSSLNMFRVFLWNLSFCRLIPIMQIRYILIKDHFFKSSLKQLKKIKPNLAGMVLMWSFNIMSDSPDLYSRWLMLQKNRNCLLMLYYKSNELKFKL